MMLWWLRGQAGAGLGDSELRSPAVRDHVVAGRGSSWVLLCGCMYWNDCAFDNSVVADDDGDVCDVARVEEVSCVSVWRGGVVWRGACDC